MKKYILTVTLNPALDKFVQIPKFKAGHDFRQNKMFLSAGGKGVNVSRVLKSLGLATLATGILGGSTGICLKRLLDLENIKNDFLFVKGDTRTNLTIIDKSFKKTTRVLEDGPFFDPRELPVFKKKLEKLLSNCKWLIISGRGLSVQTDELICYFLKSAVDKGIKTVLDSSGSMFKEGIKCKPFLIKPNIIEAQSALGLRIDCIKKAKRACAIFHSIGVKIVALTMGENGSVVSSGEQVFLFSGPRLNMGNFVGCGDAFLAGFLTAYSKGSGLSVSGKFAAACGTANILGRVPGLITKSDIRKILSDVRAKKYR